MTEEKEIGKVFSYFGNVEVVAVEISGDLHVGDTIRIKGTTTDFTQQVENMQIDREPVSEVKAGQNVGIKVIDKARPNDKVFLVE